MRIVISPAKKMKVDRDSLPVLGSPVFLKDTEYLLALLKQMSRAELKKLWKCNDQLTDLNFSRLQMMDLHLNLTPAILSYEGIQYQYMAPNVFTSQALSYIQQHLRILSGFYGILRPFDGVTPYRLEMQAKLSAGDKKDLYAFWGSRLAETLCAETDCILNLASKEYSISVAKHLPNSVMFISCQFGEEKDGKFVEKGTMCKMARGEMVRFMAENGILNPKEIKCFEGLGYRFDASRSDETTYVFILQEDSK